MTKNMEQIIGLIKQAISVEYEESLPTEDQIISKADEMRKALNMLYPITDEEYDEIKQRLPKEIIHSIGYADTLSDRDSKHVFWYQTRETDSYFWEKYRRYLLKKWSPEVVSRLNKTSDEIMDYLGNPMSDNAFQRRGLLLGDVQSGKTATYTAICNKAADAGYKVIIVLAGMMENLRKQTQERLDSEFVGLDSKYYFDKKADTDMKNIKVGVGKVEPFDDTRSIARFTSVTTDFKATALRSNNLSLDNIKGTGLFVVKKNKSILNNLHKWLTKDADILNMSVLLIDDEADNASVNTNDPETDPTAINKAINKLLRSFKQATYLGITATPFANIFIDPDIAEDGAAKDLFPRHFITLLPTPDNYIGVDKIFGAGDFEADLDRVGAEYGDAIVPILNEEQEDFYVYKHKKDLMDNIISLPPSLEEAIRYFILATAISDLRYDNNEHRSMLINVSRFTDVQNETAELVERYVDQLKSDIENYHNLDNADEIRSLSQLHDTWDKYNFINKRDISWNSLLKNHLNQAARRIVVKVANSSTGPGSLDYYAYKGVGMRVIAVGGNSLSRGLTLEGLVVSYFYRNTAMYDTLLQMGRWFGYRPNYEDLFKIWMGEDTIGWFGYITDAFNELKHELRIMKKQNKSPEDFGLKVRRSPGALMVTARNKMRTGTSIPVAITLSNSLIETPRLYADKSILEANNKLCLEFIHDIDNTEDVSSEYDEYVKAHVWHNVPYDKITKLVREYRSHPWNLNFQSEGIAEYIENNSEELKYWDVGIPQGGSQNIETIDLGDGKTVSINRESRSFAIDASVNKMIRVNERHVRVGAGGCTKVGLEKSKIKEIRATVKAEGKKSATDKDFLIEGRRPVLLLHFLDNSNYSEDIPREIQAIGLGFPGGKERRTATYIVNTTELMNYQDIAYVGEEGEE